MARPPIGKSQIIQLLPSLNCVTQSSDTKKKAEAEPESTPIKTQMRIHFEVRRKVFFMASVQSCAVLSTALCL